MTQIKAKILGIILKSAFSNKEIATILKCTFSNEEIASMIPLILSTYDGNDYMKYFTLWEKNGFHITPNHFYQPIPDTETLKTDLWEKESELIGIDMNVDFQLDLLKNIFPKYAEEYNIFPLDKTDTPYEFYFNNSAFGGTDALVLYCMVRHFKPKRILEIGSGFSTFVSAKASLCNGTTKLTCVEPYPNETLIKGFPGLTELITEKAEDQDFDFFSSLESGDILFIDTTHVVKCGGDVNFIYLEVLPRLKEGVIIQIHDIFFPEEYPKSWILDQHLFWTEQYMLQAFLSFNSSFEILFCNNYMGLKYHSEMKSTFPHSPWVGGGSIWIRKK